MIDGAKQDRTEVKTPSAVIAFLQAKRLSGEHLADEDVVATPSDFAVLAHHADLPVIGVNQLRQTGGIVGATADRSYSRMARRKNKTSQERSA